MPDVTEIEKIRIAANTKNIVVNVKNIIQEKNCLPSEAVIEAVEEQIKIMRMKQPIIHKQFMNKYTLKRYLCNQGIRTSLNKITNRWNKVTCRNCLKQKPSDEQIKKKKWCGNC